MSCQPKWHCQVQHLVRQKLDKESLSELDHNCGLWREETHSKNAHASSSSHEMGRTILQRRRTLRSRNTATSALSCLAAAARPPARPPRRCGTDGIVVPSARRGAASVVFRDCVLLALNGGRRCCPEQLLRILEEGEEKHNGEAIRDSRAVLWFGEHVTRNSRSCRNEFPRSRGKSTNFFRRRFK